MSNSVSSLTSLATQLSALKTAQAINVAVLKKAQDIQNQQGNNAVQLIASSVVSARNVDAWV